MNYCREEQESEESCFLPLTDCEGKLLPVHFLSVDEVTSLTTLMVEERGEVAQSTTVNTAGSSTCRTRFAISYTILLTPERANDNE